MSIAYVVVTLVAVAALAFIATADFVRADFVLANSASVNVPESWLTALGLLKAIGAAGLLVGLLGVPLIGEVAAIGLIGFFSGAIITHLRAGNHSLGFPGLYLGLAAASLVLSLAR